MIQGSYLLQVDQFKVHYVGAMLHYGVNVDIDKMSYYDIHNIEIFIVTYILYTFLLHTHIIERYFYIYPLCCAYTYANDLILDPKKLT